ncbi:MAG: right-handed parallel beta-helix repeat-containing protein [Candidatus Thorarchaeota archaeon]
MYQKFLLLSLFLCIMAWNQNPLCQGNLPTLTTKTSLYIEHNPIDIDSNNDFSTLGFSGSGTVNDPYIIENLNITDVTTNLITIRDTTVYFTINNCFLNSAYGTRYNGIFLRNVQYCTIIHNIITNCYSGIDIGSSNNNTIAYNSISHNNVSGIVSYDLKNSVISNNEIVNNIGTGIGGIGISRGIHMDSSDSNILFNNTILNNSDSGIFLAFNNNNNKIMNNTCQKNNFGIYLSSSHKNNLSGNIVSFNSDSGILLCDSSWNKL